MNLFDIIILAIALSIDAMVVAFSNGLIFNKQRLKKSLILASVVGFFQFGMPVIGYLFAQTITQYVKPYSHWLIFAIFFILGAKFIHDAFYEEKDRDFIFNKRYLLAVGVATSIDALFAGISISFSEIHILYPSIIIGVITFINSMLGFWITNFIRHLSSKFLEITGGLILISLAFKVLFTNYL